MTENVENWVNKITYVSYVYFGLVCWNTTVALKDR